MKQHQGKNEPTPINDIVVRNPEILGGRPVFRGTRIPIEVLFENLADGMSLDEILEEYPTLNREDAVALIEQAPAALRAA